MTMTGTRPHELVWFVSRLHEVLDQVTEAPVWSLSADEHRSLLVELTRARARLDALRLAVLASADAVDVAAETAASSTAAWLAHATRTDRRVARAEVRLAVALADPGFALTAAALAAGRVDTAQAAAIVRSVTALPATVEAADRARAQAHLVGLAADHDASALAVLGRRVFEVIDPEAADVEDGRRLVVEERAAARRSYLWLRDNGDGTSTGRFKIPSLHATALSRLLSAFTNPRHTHATQAPPQPTAKPDAQSDAAPAGSGQGLLRATAPERLGEAFCELLMRIPTRWVPKVGGMSPRIVVKLDYHQLIDELGTAVLDTGGRISASMARRLACESGIIPAVLAHPLGGESVLLDLGAEARFHTEDQRLAHTILHGVGCAADGCDRAALHAHHRIPWARGGHTDLPNQLGLCAYHHAIAHSTDYEMDTVGSGRVAFHRRT